MLRLPEMAAVQYDVVPMAGGFDQVTSAYQLNPGALRDCINFACRTNGGYYRIPGYERFDGRGEPHSAAFIAIDVTLLGTPLLTAGMVGMFGNIQGTVSFVDPFGKYVALTKTISAFNTPFVAGPIVVAAVTYGQANNYYAGLTSKGISDNKSKAANIYRADISPVPGSGPIRGVGYLNDVAYAWRDNVGATACEVYKSSAAGWVLVALGETVAFANVGFLPVADGETLTQGVVTAVIKRTVVTSGDTAASTATGYFVISGRAGGNFTAAAATIPEGAITLSTAQSAVSLLPGGTYNLSLGTFTSEKLYGADGINDAFEFDGTAYIPLPQATTAKPRYALVHANHLFLAIETSIVHSAIGNPYNYEVIGGAGEIALAAVCTGMLVLPGNQGTSALGVYARNSTWILYGNSALDWKLVNFNLGIGAWDRTQQNLFDAFAMDDRGVTQMKQSLNYGNFDAGTITYNIRPFIHSQRGLASCSGLGRENGQYRVYFTSGYGLYCTSSPQGFVGSGLVLFPDPVLCMFEGQNSGGVSYNLFGTATGFVMRNDVGTSFDGISISAYATTNINTAKTPRLRKRFRRCMLEIQSNAYVELNVGYSFEWATEKILPHLLVNTSGAFSPVAQWDTMIWDTFFWDGKADDSISVDLDGTGENVQLMLFSDSDSIAEFTIPSALFHFSPRRGNR